MYTKGVPSTTTAVFNNQPTNIVWIRSGPGMSKKAIEKNSKLSKNWLMVFAPFIRSHRYLSSVLFFIHWYIEIFIYWANIKETRLAIIMRMEKVKIVVSAVFVVLLNCSPLKSVADCESAVKIRRKMTPDHIVRSPFLLPWFSIILCVAKKTQA